MENNEIIKVEHSLLEDEDTLKDRYLTFLIADETYAIEIAYVTEIIGIQKIAKIPNIKNFIKGIISLRGIITPVIDVRCRFRINETDYNDRTCIIVVSINNINIGLIVDQVSEVVDIPTSMITAPPHTNKGTGSQFISGIGKVGDQIKIILNIYKLLYEDYQQDIETE
ncbi:MAG: hypothetical protein QG635_1794 [Bacteroidota bacterium]|nr:hypothetical protein [Bacteroidota bacterium]